MLVNKQPIDLMIDFVGNRVGNQRGCRGLMLGSSVATSFNSDDCSTSSESSSSSMRKKRGVSSPSESNGVNTALPPISSDSNQRIVTCGE